MKRRNFIGGLLATIPFFGATLEASAKKQSVTSNHTDFHRFFYEFNGFPINKRQIDAYKGYKNGHRDMGSGRREGISTFLITLAAWESKNGKNVVHFSSNHFLRDIMRKDFRDKANSDTDIVDFCSIGGNTYPLRGNRYDLAIYDVSGPCEYDKWRNIKHCVLDSLLMFTSV